MDSSNRPLQRSDAQYVSLPPPGERVVVRCQGFKCLAYRDTKGVWRADKDDKELSEVLEIVFRF